MFLKHNIRQMSGLDSLTAFPLRSSLYPEQTESQRLTLSGCCIAPDTKQPWQFHRMHQPMELEQDNQRDVNASITACNKVYVTN